jgi:hypothetical protein
MFDNSALVPILTAIDGLGAAVGSGPALTGIAIMLAPVASAALVLTWHGLRGTNPGPAASLLLKLIELLLPRRRRR